MSRYFISRITAEFGKFQCLPQATKYDGIDVSFEFPTEKQGERRAIEVTCDFDKFTGSKEEAEEKSKWLTENIALNLSLKNGLHLSYESNVLSGWQEKDGEKVTRSTPVKANAFFARRIDVVEIDYNYQDDLLKPLELFNRSLFHFEHNQEREGIFWLYLTWEALQLIFTGGKEHLLKERLTKKQVISEEECRKFKYSAGEYYRHERRRGGEQTELVLSGDQCKKIMQRILLWFAKN